MKRLSVLISLILLLSLLTGCGRDLAVQPTAPTPELSDHLASSPLPSRRHGKPTGTPAFELRVHSIYMSADEDGLFRPDDPITRGDACTAFYALLASPVEGQCSFSDLDKNDPCYEAVACLTRWGVLTDSRDDFKPDGLLSRAQLVTMLSRYYPPKDDAKKTSVGSFLSRRGEADRPGEDELPPFSDIAGHWASEAICNAVDRSWIEAGGKFYPDAAVTRGEFCHVLNRVMNRRGDSAAALLTGQYTAFADVSSNHPYFDDILEATTPHEFTYERNREYWPLGELAPGFHRISGRLYYVQDNGTLFRNGDFLCWHFDETGRYTTGDSELDSMVESSLLACTNDGQTPEEMLRSVYAYYKNRYHYLRDPNLPWIEIGDRDFENDWARDLYEHDYEGNCIAIAAGFALAARALGFPAHAVYAYYNEYYAPHSWVIIPENGVDYMYDLEQERAVELQSYSLYHAVNGELREYHYEELYGSFAAESLQLPRTVVSES